MGRASRPRVWLSVPSCRQRRKIFRPEVWRLLLPATRLVRSRCKLTDSLVVLSFGALFVGALVGAATVGALECDGAFNRSSSRRTFGRLMVLSAVDAAWIDATIPGAMPETEAPLTLGHVTMATTVGLPLDDDR